MKHLLRLAILTCLCCSALTAASQVNPKKGYVITNAGDTIHGNIDYRTDTRNCQECLFQAEGTGAFVSYKPDDIRGYRFANDGVYYVSRTFPVEGTDIRMFAEYIIQGGVSLFYYKHHGQDYYYFVDEQGEIAPMHVPNLNRLSTEEERAAKRDAMLPASQMLARSTEATKALWKSDFSRQSLTQITREYDEKYCTQWGDCIQFQYDEQTIRTALFKGFRVEAGLLLGKVRLEGEYFNSSGYQPRTEKLTLLCPHVSVGFDVAFPRLSRGLTAQVMLGYTYLKGKNPDAEWAYKNGREQSLDHGMTSSDINAELGLAYGLMPGSKVSPVVRAGAIIDYLTGISTENLERYFIHTKEMTHTGMVLIGYYAGAGADFALGRHTVRLTAQLCRNGFFFSNCGIKFLAPELRVGIRL